MREIPTTATTTRRPMQWRATCTKIPSRHMVTTSFWHSFPNLEFWSNPDYPDIDYADMHAYISTGGGRRQLPDAAR